jgi:hypothetical protein
MSTQSTCWCYAVLEYSSDEVSPLRFNIVDLMLIEKESCLSRSKVRSDLPKVLSASQKGKDKPMKIPLT